MGEHETPSIPTVIAKPIIASTVDTLGALPVLPLMDLERLAIEQSLKRHSGNRTHAARELGISVRTLQRKLKAWDVNAEPDPHSRN